VRRGKGLIISGLKVGSDIIKMLIAKSSGLRKSDGLCINGLGRRINFCKGENFFIEQNVSGDKNLFVI